MSQDDGQLVERVLAGEKTAFGLLIDRYRPQAIKLARQVLGDTFEAEEYLLTSEAMLTRLEEIHRKSVKKPCSTRGDRDGMAVFSVSTSRRYGWWAQAGGKITQIGNRLGRISVQGGNS